MLCQSLADIQTMLFSIRFKHLVNLSVSFKYGDFIGYFFNVLLSSIFLCFSFSYVHKNKKRYFTYLGATVFFIHINASFVQRWTKGENVHCTQPSRVLTRTAIDGLGASPNPTTSERGSFGIGAWGSTRDKVCRKPSLKNFAKIYLVSALYLGLSSYDNNL